MSYKFKVGDKGKTRNGLDYEVLVVDDRLCAHGQVVVAVSGRDGVRFASTRYVDGKCHEGIPSNSDLLPPTEKRWIVRADIVNLSWDYKAVSYEYTNENVAKKMLHTLTSIPNAYANPTITEIEVPMKRE